MTEKILFVDDEAAVLDGYKRALHNAYEPDLAVGGDAALSAVAHVGPYAVVVSDMRMPGIDGLQFLSQVARFSPDTVRVILTGYADLENAIAAVNEGQIFRFLTKPCAADVLKKTLAACLEQHRLLTSEKELLEQTLTRAIEVLVEVLSLSNSSAFQRAVRLRRYVRHIAGQLKLEGIWQYEIAAMLSQIGCISLSSESLKSAYRGEPLPIEEQTAFEMHPSAGRNLIKRIPRLDAVAWMVGQQRFGAALPNARVSPSMRIGAQLLRLAIAMDDQRARGATEAEAAVTVRRDPQFDPELVAPLERLPPETVGEPSEPVPISELSTGMVVQEDIRTQAGVLLAGSGQSLSEPVIHLLNNVRLRREVPERVMVARPRRCSGP